VSWSLTSLFDTNTAISETTPCSTPPTLLWTLASFVLSKFCYYHICQVCGILPYLHCKITATSVHSQLDYCNTLYYNLPKCQIYRLKQIQNSLTCAVDKAAKSCHTSPILCSLHRLTITECIQYKLQLLTYKVLTTKQPSYLHKFITVQPPCSTRSSSLSRPPASSSLRTTDRSFRYASGCLWN